MIGPFYGTRGIAPARRSRPSLLSAAILLTGGLLGCGDDRDPAASDARSSSASPPLPTINAADRDASLDAIDRWLQAGRPDNAASIARTLVDRLPADRHAQAALGRVLLARSGELRESVGPAAAASVAAEAADALRKAVDLAPAEDAPAVEARRSLGLALESAGRDSDAVSVYRDGADDPVCRLYLGLALLRLDAVDEAAEILEALAAARPDDSLVRAAVAEALLRQSRVELAIAAAAEAVRLDPTSWPIRVRRASILRRAGDPRAAIESLLALDDDSRGHRSVAEEIAAAYHALDRPARAAEIWAERARATPEDLDAALAAAVAFQTAGDDDRAETWLEIATLAAPNDPRVPETRRRIADLRATRTDPVR